MDDNDNDKGREGALRKAHVEALEREAEGYRRRNLTDRVAEVQAELDRLNGKPERATVKARETAKK